MSRNRARTVGVQGAMRTAPGLGAADPRLRRNGAALGGTELTVAPLTQVDGGKTAIRFGSGLGITEDGLGVLTDPAGFIAVEAGSPKRVVGRIDPENGVLVKINGKLHYSPRPSLENVRTPGTIYRNADEMMRMVRGRQTSIEERTTIIEREVVDRTAQARQRVNNDFKKTIAMMQNRTSLTMYRTMR